MAHYIQVVLIKWQMVTLHTNKSHTATSVKLFHFKDLSKRAKVKAKGK